MENALALNESELKGQFASLDNGVFRNVLLTVHFAVGILFKVIPIIAVIWTLTFSVYAIGEILRTKNRNNFAMYAAAYICAFEIVTRSLRCFELPWEFGKYASSTFLMLGMIVEKDKRKIPIFAIIYLLLLVPSIFVGDYHTFLRGRTNISFNLSGPLSLSVSWLYFYRRKLAKPQIAKIIFWFVLPIVTVLMVIILKMPSISDANLTLQSNKGLSGGYGPNQISIMMGFAFFLMIFAWLLEMPIFGLRAIDTGVALAFLVEGLLTFSRGGVLTGFICSFIAVVVSARNGSSKQLNKIGGMLLIFIFVGFIGWQIVNNATGGFLTARYEKMLGEGSRVDDVTKSRGFDVSGRDVIVTSDLEIFEMNPILGVGPGCSASAREKLTGFSVVAHTELTRLLSEHGIYGLVALLIVLISPLINYGKSEPQNRVFLVSFAAFSLITMSHSAMRVAVIGFAYGLAFILISGPTLHPLQRSVKAEQ